MDLDMLGALVQTLIQQNMMLNHKVDNLTQELGALKTAVHQPQPTNYSTMDYRGLSTSAGSNPMITTHNILSTNPLATSNANNSVLSPNPLSISNPNNMRNSATSPAHFSPGHFSPPYPSSSPAFPFSAHPLELRGVSSGAVPSTNPFTTATSPTSSQPLSLANFPH